VGPIWRAVCQGGLIQQRVEVEHETLNLADKVELDDAVDDGGTGIIPHEVQVNLSSLPGTSNYQTIAWAAVSGAVGLRVSEASYVGSILSADVQINSDEFVNDVFASPHHLPIHVRSTVLIDGGRLLAFGTAVNDSIGYDYHLDTEIDSDP